MGVAWEHPHNAHGTPSQGRVRERWDLRCIASDPIYGATQGHANWPCMALDISLKVCVVHVPRCVMQTQRKLGYKYSPKCLTERKRLNIQK